MHTIIVISCGFIVLGLCVLIGRWLGRPIAAAALAFLPIWLAASTINMVVGVESAGYTYAQELPIFLLVFGLPAVAALALYRLAR